MELGILILPVTLQMLPDGNSLLDKVVAVLGQLWEGVRPFLASLKIWSLTSSDVSFNHCGTDLLYGRADWEIPFPGACMRPMVICGFYLSCRSESSNISL